MTVALGTTLIDLEISTLLYKGQWERVVDRLATGTDIFIGAGVTEFAEAGHSDIDLCAEVEALFGFVLGYVPQLETIDSGGYYYRDYDNCFPDNSWLRIGIPKQGIDFLVLSGTAKTIAKGDKIKCVDGVWQRAVSNDNYQMLALEAVTAAANTRKYFYARWVKN